MKNATISGSLLFLLLCLAGVAGAADDNFLRLNLPGHPNASAQLTVRRGDDGSLFVLDRSSSTLCRINPAGGTPLWHVDGSETGNEFIDPAWLSRPDGFYVFLTDRGSRRVWRVDYRGELRGAVELSFATDPVLLEIASGGQLLVYDRATGLLHLLDDSGRQLWGFPPGEGRTSAEPLKITVGPSGERVYLLWRDAPQLTVVGLSGQSSRRVDIPGGLRANVISMAVAGKGDDSILALVTADNKLLRLDTWSGALREIELKSGSAFGICGDSGGFTVLTGPEPTLRRLTLEECR